MIGAIAGDIIGSLYERSAIKTTDFPLFQKNSRFTDDTIMTLATCDSLLNQKKYGETYKQWGRNYPNAGYGGFFYQWLWSDSLEPYNSFGNGSAMRVSPIGFAFNTLEDVLGSAKKSAQVTHSHLEGIKGAQAISSAVFLGRQKKDKLAIKKYIEKKFQYNLNQNLDQIRKDYIFDVTCQGSVPEAILSFLESTNLESAIRLAVSLGGDSDTLACMAGGIAQAYYGEISKEIVKEVQQRIPFKCWKLLQAFEENFQISYQIV